MAHRHSVYDTNLHFMIDPVTRVISNQVTSKATLIQGDHNSERLTFELPRLVDGHDMTLCDIIEVHFLNVSAEDKTQTSEDVYKVDDLGVCPEDADVAIFSWLISGNATKYEGLLSFCIRFVCLTGEVIDYAWHTGIYNNVTVGEGFNFSESVIADTSDVLEAWKREVLGEAEAAVTRAEAAASVVAGAAEVLEKVEALNTNFDFSEAGFIPLQNGAIYADEKYRSTPYIPLFEHGTFIPFVYNVRVIGTIGLAFYSSPTAASFITAKTLTEDITKLVDVRGSIEWDDIPQGAKYFRISSYYNASYYLKYGSVKNRIVPEDESIVTQHLADGAITYDKQSFIVRSIGNNAYDCKSMLQPKVWYWHDNGKVFLQKNQYTDPYMAASIPVDCSKSHITLSSLENTLIYSWFMADADDNILTSTVASQVSLLNNPLTIEIPEGATSLKLSLKVSSEYQDLYLTKGVIMANYGEEALPYEDYYNLYKINGDTIITEAAAEKIITEKASEVISETVKEEIEAQTTVKLLTLPRRFNLVVGDTFEMFYKGISNVLDSNIYDYEISFSDGVSRGKAWKRNYEWTPTAADVGTKTMTVVVRDNLGNEIDSGTVDLVISNVPSSPASVRAVCCVGDSITEGGTWCSELRRRLSSADGTPAGYGLANINFIGSKETADGCKYEGYGGWTFNLFLNESKNDSNMYIYGSFDKINDDQHAVYKDSNGVNWKLETIGASAIKIIRTSSSGTLPASGRLTWVSGGVNKGDIVYTSSGQAAGNPFWNGDAGKLDFTAYASKMGVATIDHMIILLGWNSTNETEEGYKAQVKSFIDCVRSDFPNCKITLVGIQVPSRDGFANNYGIGWKYYQKLQFVWLCNKVYQEVADEYDGVEFVNLAGQFDAEYNCMTMTKKPNVRSSTDITVQSNGVHPSGEGRKQIADAVLRNFIARLN